MNDQSHFTIKASMGGLFNFKPPSSGSSSIFSSIKPTGTSHNLFDFDSGPSQKSNFSAFVSSEPMFAVEQNGYTKLSATDNFNANMFPTIRGSSYEATKVFAVSSVAKSRPIFKFSGVRKHESPTPLIDTTAPAKLVFTRFDSTLSTNSRSTSIGHDCGAGPTLEERLRLLEERDKADQAFRQSTINASSENKSVTIGTCPDMCPETERYTREVRHQVSIFELSEGAPGRMDHTRAVKDYTRSAADQAESLPRDLRPAEVLERTMNYLLASVADRPESDEGRGGNLWKPWYEFLWSRTRAIRREITQQRLCSPSVAAIVEKITRFHIFCAARLVDQPVDAFDPKINSEHLTKCLQTLKELYGDLQSQATTPQCPCEPEFRAYMILMKLNDASVLDDVQKFSGELRKSVEVRFAVEVYRAVAEHNFVRFFRMVRACALLPACILHRYFGQMRARALCALSTALCGGPKHQVLYPLSRLVQQLGFESMSEASDFCELWGLEVDGRSVVFKRHYPPQQPDLIRTEKRAPSLIESKRGGILLSSLFNGSPIDPSWATPDPIHSSFDSQGRLLPVQVVLRKSPFLPTIPGRPAPSAAFPFNSKEEEEDNNKVVMVSDNEEEGAENENESIEEDENYSSFKSDESVEIAEVGGLRGKERENEEGERGEQEDGTKVDSPLSRSRESNREFNSEVVQGDEEGEEEFRSSIAEEKAQKFHPAGWQSRSEGSAVVLNKIYKSLMEEENTKMVLDIVCETINELGVEMFSVDIQRDVVDSETEDVCKATLSDGFNNLRLKRHSLRDWREATSKERALREMNSQIHHLLLSVAPAPSSRLLIGDGIARKRAWPSAYEQGKEDGSVKRSRLSDPVGELEGSLAFGPVVINGVPERRYFSVMLPAVLKPHGNFVCWLRAKLIRLPNFVFTSSLTGLESGLVVLGRGDGVEALAGNIPRLHIYPPAMQAHSVDGELVKVLHFPPVSEGTRTVAFEWNELLKDGLDWLVATASTRVKPDEEEEIKQRGTMYAQRLVTVEWAVSKQIKRAFEEPLLNLIQEWDEEEFLHPDPFSILECYNRSLSPFSQSLRKLLSISHLPKSQPSTISWSEFFQLQVTKDALSEDAFAFDTVSITKYKIGSSVRWGAVCFHFVTKRLEAFYRTPKAFETLNGFRVDPEAASAAFSALRPSKVVPRTVRSSPAVPLSPQRAKMTDVSGSLQSEVDLLRARISELCSTAGPPLST